MDGKETEGGDAGEELRRQIMEIQRDPTLSAAEKARRSQALHMAKWTGSAAAMGAAASAGEAPDNEFEVSYHDEAKGILGCKHYPRKCKKRAPCCGFLFPCRICHDEQVADHEIDRFAVTEVYCMLCNTLQPVASHCNTCGVEFARYFCPLCKFFDDTPDRDIYHCHDCGLCRRGKREEFVHCRTCDMCITASQDGSHICIEGKLRANCPVCHDNMFSSTKPVSILRCGHCMHRECEEAYVRTNIICPLCSKSLFDMTEEWAHYDELMQIYIMPAEYAGARASILCNDCGAKSLVAFHFQGHKCSQPACGSYNTRVTATSGLPNGLAPPAPEAVPAPPAPPAPDANVAPAPMDLGSQAGRASGASDGSDDESGRSRDE